MSLRKLGAIATLVAGVMTPAVAAATGLGEIRVTSQLGDRFQAEIPLLNPSPSIVPSCFNLTTTAADAIADVTWLKDAQIALISSPPRLVISTRRQVSEPVVQLAIYTGCGTYLTRHYTALLSPPGEVSSLPAPLPAIRDDRVAVPSAADAKHVSKNPITARNGRAHRVVAARPKPKAVAKGAQRRAEPVSRDRLVLLPSDEQPPSERGVATASAEEVGNRLTEVERQIMAMRSRLTALHAEHPAPPPAIQTVLIEMESRLLAVELNMARIKVSSLAAEAQAKLTPASMPVSVAIHEQTGPSAGSNIGSNTGPASAAAVAPAAPKTLQNKEVPVPGLDQQHVFGVGMALLGMFSLALGTYLFRRARRVQVTSDLPRASEVPRRQAPSSPRQIPGPSTMAPIDDAGDGSPRARSAESANPSARAIKETQKEEPDFSPIELANIMLSFGREQGAVEVLEEFIKDNPAESLQPGLRLLEIYKQADMRQEYEMLAGRLAHRFNVERVHWNQEFLPATDALCAGIDARRAPGNLNAMPTHIKARIAANWGTSECLAYLRALFNDTRGGARKGFSVLVTQEILSVIKTLETQLQVTKTA